MKTLTLFTSPAKSLPVFSIHPDAVSLKLATIKRSSAITIVNSPETMMLARTELDAVNNILKTLEACRKVEKKPLLDLGKDLDAKAEAFAVELEAEKKRVSGIMSSYEMEEHRKRVAAKEEADRLEREQAEATRKQQLAAWEQQEAERIAAERAAAVESKSRVSMKERLAAEKAAEEAAAARALAEQQETERQRVEQASLDARALVTIKARGANLKLDFEVVDLDAAYKAYPTLFKVEIKRVDALYMLNRGIVIPGIRTFQTMKIT